jgi:hypothetical protein
MQHRLLPLNDRREALQPPTPHLPWSAFHRCLQRHGISHFSDVERDKPWQQKFNCCPASFFHIDMSKAQTT